MTNPKVLTLNNYPDSWQQRYHEAGYLQVDPSVRLGHISRQPLIWSDEMFAETPQLWAEARDQGLGVGWAQSSLDGFPWMEKYNRAWELRRELRDDRVLGFSRRFDLEPGKTATFVYAVRVVSAGVFILPGSSVEAMYAPAIRARGASQRIRVEK